MGGMATPMGLMAMGASIEFKGAFENMRPVILAVLLKLVILAGVFLPIAVTLGFRTEKLIAILVMARLGDNGQFLCYGKKYGA